MADFDLPELKSDAAKELAPYLLTILRTQAVLLEKAGHMLAHQEDAERAPDKHDIYDDLLRQVKLAAEDTDYKPLRRATVREFKPKPGGQAFME